MDSPRHGVSAELGLAASFNPSLVRDVGEAIGHEARTKGITVMQDRS